MPSSVREVAFLAIKKLTAHVADAIRAIEMEMTDVNFYAGRLEPEWLERAPLAKLAVEHLLLRAADEIERAPLVLRLMDAIGTDPASTGSDLLAVMVEGLTESQGHAPDQDDPRLADGWLPYARWRLFSATFSMGTRVLVNASDAGGMLSPGWRIAGNSGCALRTTGPCLMKAIEAYIAADDAHWVLAQTQAEAGLSMVGAATPAPRKVPLQESKR
jgi:hypothetical protein